MVGALGRTLEDAQAILSILWAELSRNIRQGDINLETTQLPGQKGGSHGDRRKKKSRHE